MGMNLFSDLVKKHFHYLLEVYKFTVAKESYSPEIMGNAEIVFTSLSTGIGIVLDRDQVLINIGAITQPKGEWFEFGDVVRSFAGDVENIYAFDEGYAALETQIARLAHIMHTYCGPFLAGDFSKQKEIKEIENRRVSEMLNRFNKHRD